MQDPTTFQAMKPQFPEQEQLKCPRCDSTNTKFCYYNNYNLSQPRHFCKNCRRYWTKGGALRNIPVGGGTRKNTKRPPSTSSSTSTAKRSSLSSPSPSPSSVPAQPDPTNPGHDPTRFHGNSVGGGPMSFSSLLASTVHWGGLWEGLNSNGSGLRMMQLNNGFGGSNDLVGSGNLRNLDSGMERQSNGNGGNSEGFLGNKQNVDSSCWSNGGSTNGWSDLAIYTPGSSYQ